MGVRCFSASRRNLNPDASECGNKHGSTVFRCALEFQFDARLVDAKVETNLAARTCQQSNCGGEHFFEERHKSERKTGRKSKP